MYDINLSDYDTYDNGPTDDITVTIERPEQDTTDYVSMLVDFCDSNDEVCEAEYDDRAEDLDNILDDGVCDSHLNFTPYKFALYFEYF
jgi:hypothetical protein